MGLDQKVQELRARMRAAHGNNAVLIVDVIVLMKSAITHAHKGDRETAQDHVFQVLQIMLIALNMEDAASSISKFGLEFEELLVNEGAAGRGDDSPGATLQ